MPPARRIRDLRDFLLRDLASRRHFINGDMVPDDATPEEFGVFSTVEVTETESGGVDVYYVEGPGFFCSEIDILQLAQEAVARAEQELPWLASEEVVVREGEAWGIPEALREAIRATCQAYLEEKTFFVGAIGETDVERWKVLLYPILNLPAPNELLVAWATGPGRARLAADEHAGTLTGDLADRLRSQFPELSDFDIQLEFDDDEDDSPLED